MSERLSGFWESLTLIPDEFQIEAGQAMEDGHSVVVTAPTGSGKTLVADAAIYLALLDGKRVFYTTPIKALSNQKYGDLVDIHGPENVGLLTGDNVINGDADIVVMTTEVLRNMIYADASRLDRVSYVILDEVHYLQDRMRGAVWEEVIVHCPDHIRLVCLSATVSNNAEFAAWVGERRGSTRLISTEHRPVPLESMYMIKDKVGSRTLHLLPTFVTRDGRRRPNARIEHMLGLERGRKQRFTTPNRTETIERLAQERMLPAIYFIFSRAGCDSAARRLADAGVRLTDSDERKAIVEIAETRTAHLEDADLKVLGYNEWAYALEQGIGAHHAGLVPAFKETVEELFEAGLLKVVFATETLALGINMPARSVVIENLSRFNGETHELLRPGDYTQLTGRAGRRGIDVEGFGIVLHSQYVRFSNVTEIAAIGSHELTSSFRPTYNMTANLISKYAQDEAEELLASSFAAYQREGAKHEASRTIEALESQYATELERATCERGSVEEYLSLIESSRPAPHADGIASILGEGSVVDVAGGARQGRYVVLKKLPRKPGARYLVLSTSGRVSTIGYKEIVAGSAHAADLDLQRPVRPRDRKYIQTTLRSLRKLPAPGKSMTARSDPEDLHPVASCPDASRHLASARRAKKLARKLEQYRSARRSSGFGLVEEFHSIVDLLQDMGYAEGWDLTARGQRLRGVYNESDLLLTECLERGVFYALDPRELASLLSTFVYEPRSDQVSPADFPTPELTERWARIEEIWADLVDRERKARLTPTRRPDPGFAVQAYKWVSGEGFESISSGAMAPGDFVRVSRQLVDLLKQVRDIAPDMNEESRDALRSLDRGVVRGAGRRMNRWLVAVNHRAGRNSISPGVVIDAVTAAGVDFDIVTPSTSSEMVEMIESEAGRGRTHFALVGGDGTVSLAIDTLMRLDLDQQPVLGVLPAGTGCDLLRTFGISQDLGEAARHLSGTDIYVIDVPYLDGAWGRRYFVNVAQAGVGAAAAQTAPRLSRRMGAARYPIAFAGRLPRFPKAEITLVTERKTIESEALAVILANAQFFAGGWNVAPKATLIDGVLDVQIINTPKRSAPTLVPKVVKGTHLGDKAVRRLSAAEFELTVSRVWPVEADGDYLGNTNITGRVIPAAIKLKI